MISFKDMNAKYDPPARMKPAKMTAAMRKKASKVVRDLLAQTWFPEIPMRDLIEALKKVDVIVLQEDNTEWSGMLMGSNSHALFTLGDYSKSENHAHGKVYTPFVNAGLLLTWYRSDARKSNKIEVIGYIS